jgi:hypothetical protein
MREQSKHFVSILDYSAMQLRISKYWTDAGKLADNEILVPRCPFGIVEKSGQHFLINSEGVGDKSSIEDTGFKLYWYKEEISRDGQVTSFSMIPNFESVLSYSELMAECKIAKRILLHEFIRSVPNKAIYHRLDQNSDEWDYFLSN